MSALNFKLYSEFRFALLVVNCKVFILFYFNFSSKIYYISMNESFKSLIIVVRTQLSLYSREARILLSILVVHFVQRCSQWDFEVSSILLPLNHTIQMLRTCECQSAWNYQKLAASQYLYTLFSIAEQASKQANKPGIRFKDRFKYFEEILSSILCVIRYWIIKYRIHTIVTLSSSFWWQYLVSICNTCEITMLINTRWESCLVMVSLFVWMMSQYFLSIWNNQIKCDNISHLNI